MHFTIEHEREEVGRWQAEVPELPDVLIYGASADQAMAKAEVLALRVLAERLEHGERGPQPYLDRHRGGMSCQEWALNGLVLIDEKLVGMIGTDGPGPQRSGLLRFLK